MGMGYGSNMAVVIERDVLEKLLPTETSSLLTALYTVESSLEEFAASVQVCGTLEDISEEEEKIILDAYTSLVNAFKEKTSITLALGYHDKNDQGDIYDSVDGAFFYLDWGDMYDTTPEAKALKASGVEFDMKSWVTYG